MAFKPSFVEVTKNGDKIEVDGLSDPEHLAVIHDIVIGLKQGRRMEYRSIDEMRPDWTATFDCEDSATPPGPAFDIGPALVVGVEIRTDPMTTATWSEDRTITHK